jgi:RNA polymerase sigma-70 factor (ECF subfamily)
VGTLLRRLHLRNEPAAAGEPDAALVARARQDRQAFAALYDRYFAPLYRYCSVRLGSSDRAEDAVHQIFLRAMEAVDRYQETGRFRSWLFTIAHNVVADELRTRPRGVTHLDLAIAIDPAAGPEADALAASERRALRAALALLPDDQRRAIELRLAGLTGREIAAELGRSHEAAKMLQQRALTRLRVEMGAATQKVERHDA